MSAQIVASPRREMSVLRALARRARARAPSPRAAALATRARAPPPPMTSVDALWEEVRDARSGQIYYWQTETDETTPLGAPRPTTYSALDPTMPAPTRSGTRAPPPSRDLGAAGGSAAGGFGSMIAQGAAWGMGSSLGHRAIGGMFGYGGYGGVGGVGGGEGAIGEAGGTEAPAPPDFGASEFDDDDGFGDGGSDGGSLFDFFSED